MGWHSAGMVSEVRVCPFCGHTPGVGMFCAACGRNLAAVERLPTRTEWESTETASSDAGSGRGGSSRPVAERCAAATEAFLAAMHAAGNPGTTDVFARGSGLRRTRRPPAWVLRRVHREPDDDLNRYEPGLVLTIEGRFHRLESEVRGWGQRDFPLFVDTAAQDAIEMPIDPRVIAELDALLRENGVIAEPPLTSL